MGNTTFKLNEHSRMLINKHAENGKEENIPSINEIVKKMKKDSIGFNTFKQFEKYVNKKLTKPVSVKNIRKLLIEESNNRLIESNAPLKPMLILILKDPHLNYEQKYHIVKSDANLKEYISHVSKKLYTISLQKKTRFGKKANVSRSVKNDALRLRIRLTTTRNGKRFPKSEKLLKKQIKSISKNK
jgi:hypothetical protein